MDLYPLSYSNNQLHIKPIETKVNLDLSNESTPLLLYATPHHPKNASLLPTNVPLYKKSQSKIQIWLLTYVLFFVLYLIIGSVIFQQLEINEEMGLRSEFQVARMNFLKKYTNVLDDDLEEFISEVVKINGRGVSVLRNATSDMNWSFGQALFFSTTVITTIGYGHVTPLTQNGKIFCICYAMIGIPLTLVLLSAMVERFLVPANWILTALNSKLGHLYQPFNIRLLHLLIIALMFIITFLLIPTFVFTRLEKNWNYLDAFYYCFVSLTTIGLGDYIPGDELDQPHRSMYKIFITCYLIFGLVAMMLMLTVFYDIPQLNLGQLLLNENGSEHSEKLRLSLGNTPTYSGPSGLYIPQRDDECRRSVVRIRPRLDDSPSPDDETPITAKELRVP